MKRISETRFLHIPHHDFSLRMMKPGFSLHQDCCEKQIRNAKPSVTKTLMLGYGKPPPNLHATSLEFNQANHILNSEVIAVFTDSTGLELLINS
jgi:hypothetical protein